jgi:hypothetical protein
LVFTERKSPRLLTREAIQKLGDLLENAKTGWGIIGQEFGVDDRQ